MDQLDDDSGFLPFAPDLAVEVVSPNDAFAAVEKKAFSWLDAGTQVVLIVEPESENIHVVRSRAEIIVLQSGQVIDINDVISGLRIQIVDIFS